MAGQDEMYMFRCLELAKLGSGNVAPNPMVGAVLVYADRIIGEGYHKKYGGPHAEVNCINSVNEEDKALINKSTLYVSLEPCAHYGKTPPCSDIIIRNKIPKVVIGCRDPFKKVDGRGIEKLKAAGVEVVLGILEKECINLNRRFFTFQQKQRPYIILKWAQTADKKIAVKNSKRLLISNEITNRLIHKWRSEEPGILIGTNTAILDNPSLTNRFWNGKNPVRLVIDLKSKLRNDLKIFNDKSPTIVFKDSELNAVTQTKQASVNNNSKYYNFRIINNTLTVVNLLEINAEEETKKDNPNIKKSQKTIAKQLSTNVNKREDYKYKILKKILTYCHNSNITSILVEGGKNTLTEFIKNNLFDEIRIITNTSMIITEGIEAPEIQNIKKVKEFKINEDLIEYYES